MRKIVDTGVDDLDQEDNLAGMKHGDAVSRSDWRVGGPVVHDLHLWLTITVRNGVPSDVRKAIDKAWRFAALKRDTASDLSAYVRKLRWGA